MKAQGGNYKTVSVVAFLGALLLAVGYNFYTPETSETSSDVQTSAFIPKIDYNFDVYCPVDSAEKLKQINSALGFNSSALDFNFRTNEQVYVVMAKAQPEDS